jgi:hypothetical protein
MPDCHDQFARTHGGPIPSWDRVQLLPANLKQREISGVVCGQEPSRAFRTVVKSHGQRRAGHDMSVGDDQTIS